MAPGVEQQARLPEGVQQECGSGALAAEARLLPESLPALPLDPGAAFTPGAEHWRLTLPRAPVAFQA